MPTTSVGARRARAEGASGTKGSEVYVIVGFRAPITSVGAKGKGSNLGQGGEGEQGVCSPY